MVFDMLALAPHGPIPNEPEPAIWFWKSNRLPRSTFAALPSIDVELHSGANMALVDHDALESQHEQARQHLLATAGQLPAGKRNQTLRIAGGNLISRSQPEILTEPLVIGKGGPGPETETERLPSRRVLLVVETSEVVLDIPADLERCRVRIGQPLPGSIVSDVALAEGLGGGRHVLEQIDIGVDLADGATDHGF